MEENITEVTSILKERLNHDREISEFIEPIQLDFECENLNKFTLQFQTEMEKEFQKLFTDLDYNVKPVVFSHPAVNFLFYMIGSTTFFGIIVMVACIANPLAHNSSFWIPLSMLCVVIEIIITIVLATLIFKKDINKKGKFISFMSHYLSFVFIILPILLIFLLFRTKLFLSQSINPNWIVLMLAAASLFHLCLFPYILFFIKFLIASITTLGWLFLLYSPFYGNNVEDYRYSKEYLNNISSHHEIAVRWILNGSSTHEIMLSFILILILVVFIIREYNLIYRKLFFTEQKGVIQKREVEIEKERADWLLRNIIPDFVIDPLLMNHRYAKDYACVGVAFITLTNYLTELYEEQFEGGQFYGRVLNEFFADVDAMLLQHAKKLEKIKTIGPTYMVASGLDPASENSTDHLYTLMDFVIEFKKAAERFSQDLFNFKFVVRTGYNFGPVTAGVIGTNRLLFDIWGDTVNVASRMDSKGIDNRIQVPKHVADTLQTKYSFSYRGNIFIKGKDMMDTYLVEE